MSRLKALLRVSSISPGNTQQDTVQACNAVAQHVHTAQQPLLRVAGVSTETAKHTPTLDPNLPHWAWRLFYADRKTKEIYTLPEATRAEIMQLWPEIIGAEPFERVTGNELAPEDFFDASNYPEIEIDPCAIDPSDNRRCCLHCTNLTQQGKCLAAFRGEILASRNFSPIKDQPHRCVGYKPLPHDPDQRPVVERWPGLIESDAAARKRYAEPPA